SRRSDRSNVDVTSIAKVAGRAERRIRAARALTWGSEAACVALVAAVVTLVLRKTNHFSERSAWIAFSLEAALVVAVAIAGWVRKLPSRAGALALDRHHDLADRLASALSFGELPQKERTPFMDAAIDDALAVVQSVEPKKAVPIPPPYEAPVLG